MSTGNGRRHKKLPWRGEIEELVNLAQNKLSMNPSQLQHAIGISDSNFAVWRRENAVPAWFRQAIRGMLATVTDSSGQPQPVQVGLQLTTDQLELLNIALSEHARRNPEDASVRRLRSAILLELASRLDR